MKEDGFNISMVWDALKRRVAYIPHIICFFWPFGFYRKNRQKIKKYKNIHKGKRCFVIANGPSLKKIDFNLLKDEYTIGMNRIYLMKEINGFVPNYLMCCDEKTQLLQFTDEYDNLDLPCFYNFKLRNRFSKKTNQQFFASRFKIKFVKDFSTLAGNGGSVCFNALELAYYMGFEEVYLIGKDHSYNTTEKYKVLSNTGEEQNHFSEKYYKPGQIWGTPDYFKEEMAYRKARLAYEKNGRIIKDATIDGKLDVFEKVNFLSLFE